MPKLYLEKNYRKGYTLIEMLVVLTIIGILAAIAIPIYLGQTTKAKLVEVTNAMSYIVTALSTYHHEAGQNGAVHVWPSCGNITAIQTSLGVGIPSGRISAASVDQSTGVLSVTIANIDSAVNNSRITLTPVVNINNSTISWKWGGTIPPQYRPKE